MKNKYTATLLREFNKYASDNDISIPGAIGGGVAGGTLGGVGHFGHEANKFVKFVKNDLGDPSRGMLNRMFSLFKGARKYPNTFKTMYDMYRNNKVRPDNKELVAVSKSISKDIWKIMRKNPKLLAATVGVPTLFGAYLGS